MASDFTAVDVAQTGNLGSSGDRAASSASGLTSGGTPVSDSLFLKAFDTSIKVVDEGIRYQALEDARQTVEDEQAFVRQAEFDATIQETTKAPPPPEVKDKMRELDRLQSASDAGKLDRTAYFSRLDAAARQLRSRYPGYRDEIDAAISKYSGVKPANAVVDSIFDRREQMLRSNPEAKERDYYEKELIKFGNSTHLIMEQNGQRMDTLTMKKLVADAHRKKLDRETEKDNLNTIVTQTNLGEKRNEIVTKEIGSALSREAQRTVETIHDNMFSVNTKSEIGRLVQESQKMREEGRIPTPQDQAKYDQAAISVRNQATKAFNDYLGTKMASGKTVAEYLGSITEVNKQREAFMAQIKPYTDALSTNNLSAVESIGNGLKAAKQYGEAGLKWNNEEFNRQAAFKDAMGETVYIETMKLSESLKGRANYWADTRIKWLGQMDISRVASAPSGAQVPGAAQLMKDQQARGVDSNQFGNYTKGLLDSNLRGMASTTLPVTQREKHFMTLFGPQNGDFMKEIKDGGRVAALDFLTSSETTKAVKELDAKKPGMYQMYQNWVAKNAQVAIFNDISELNSSTSDERSVKKLAFKETSGKLELSSNPVFVGNRPNYRYGRDQADIAVENINKTLTLYGHVFGSKPEDIRQFLIGAGLNAARPIDPAKGNAK